MKIKSKLGIGMIGIMFFLLFVSLLNASISDLTPEDNYWSNNNTINFTFTLSNYTNTSCSLIVDNIIEQTKIANSSNYFTNLLSQGEHSWNINCSDGNTTQESGLKTITIDTTAPEINLTYPEDNVNYTNVTNVVFEVSDNLATNLNCSLNFNGDLQNETINTGEQNVSINSIIGINIWNVSCQDLVLNKVVSETRTFFVENQTIETQTEPDNFEIELEYPNYNIGENALMQISAVNGSNVTIEVCPNEQGFVLCYNNLEFTSNEYPITEIMPYTNKSGDYILEGIMKYGNITKTYSLNFTINNNINVDVDGDTSITKGEKTEISLDVSGGIAPYTYNWNLDNGGTSDKQALNFTYDESGVYNHLVTITDKEGNEKNITISINVKKLYSFKIIVSDANNGNLLNGVILSVDDYDGTTNSNGQVIFSIPKSTYNIFASKSGYTLYSQNNYRLSENSTMYIEMLKHDDKKPVVELTYPEDGDKINGQKLDLKFKVDDDASSVTCYVYTGDDSSSWLTKQETITVTSTNEQTVSLTNFDFGNYSLKIECEDQNNNIGETDKIEVEFVNKSVKTDYSGDDDLVKQLYSLLDALPQKTAQQKQVLDALGFEDIIKQAIKTVERTTRDIYNVEYRRDLSDSEKKEKQKELMDKIDEIYKTTPINLNVIESKSFIRYIKDDELRPIVSEYLDEQEYTSKESYIQAAIQTQNEATISSNVKTVDMMYFDGRTEKITLVVKNFDYVNDTKKFKVIENIPKEVISSTDNMIIVTDHKIIKKDPMIEFDTPKRIVYYIKEQKSPELFERTNAIILPESYSEALSMITGNAIFSGDFSFSGTTALIVLIIILVVIYGGYSLDTFDKVKFFYFIIFGDKKLHNLKMLINDASDSIDAKKYEEAYLIYREIKLFYDKLSLPAKNEVYDSVISICNKLDFEYAQQMLEEVTKKLGIGEKEKAGHLYKKLRAIYKKLNDEDKQKIYDDILKVSGRIAQ